MVIESKDKKKTDNSNLAVIVYLYDAVSSVVCKNLTHPKELKALQVAYSVLHDPYPNNYPLTADLTPSLLTLECSIQ